MASTPVAASGLVGMILFVLSMGVGPFGSLRPGLPIPHHPVIFTIWTHRLHPQRRICLTAAVVHLPVARSTGVASSYTWSSKDYVCRARPAASQAVL